jgi:membrane fusion protein (multidrug efflux system)
MSRPHVFSVSLRNPVLVLAALLPLALFGCGDRQQGGGGFSMPPMPVEVAPVTSGRVVDRFSAVGSLEASESIMVAAEIDGAVARLPFAEGRAIAAGELIAQLDDAELAAQVARAVAVRDQQQATYDRTRDVVEQRAGAPQDLDDAAAALMVAEAELDLARARLAKTRITAPFAGITGVRLVSPGAFLRAGTPITELARIDELRVNFTAPERLLARMEEGATVQVTTSAFADLVVEGTIDVVAPVLDPTTRSARIVARIDNPGRRLRPGMSAEVTVVLAARDQALTVPSEAVFVQNGQTMVYVVQADSTVAPRPVTLGLRQADSVEVVTGLTADLTVVRAGHQKIYPGARVVPMSGAPAAGSEAGR